MLYGKCKYIAIGSSGAENTAGENDKKIAEYIRRQLEEVQTGEQQEKGKLLSSPITSGE